MAGVGLQVLQQLAGINTVMYFTPAILELAGIHDKRLALLVRHVPGTLNRTLPHLQHIRQPRSADVSGMSDVRVATTTCCSTQHRTTGGDGQDMPRQSIMPIVKQRLLRMGLAERLRYCRWPWHLLE